MLKETFISLNLRIDRMEAAFERRLEEAVEEKTKKSLAAMEAAFERRLEEAVEEKTKKKLILLESAFEALHGQVKSAAGYQQAINEIREELTERRKDMTTLKKDNISNFAAIRGLRGIISKYEDVNPTSDRTDEEGTKKKEKDLIEELSNAKLEIKRLTEALMQSNSKLLAGRE